MHPKRDEKYVCLDIPGAAKKLGMSTHDVERSLEQLRAVGLIEIDRENRLIRIPNVSRYTGDQRNN